MKRKGIEAPEESKAQVKKEKDQRGILKAAPAGKIVQNRQFVKYGAVSKKATLRQFSIEDGYFVEGK